MLQADDDKVNNPVSDDWLQTEAATANYDRKTSVNVGFQQRLGVRRSKRLHTWAAANYDAATRDAAAGSRRRPAGDLRVSGSNSGAGTDNGLNASPGTISAPGATKNVITVGAIEASRNIEGRAITSVTNTVTEIDEDGEEVEKEVITTAITLPFAGAVIRITSGHATSRKRHYERLDEVPTDGSENRIWLRPVRFEFLPIPVTGRMTLPPWQPRCWWVEKIVVDLGDSIVTSLAPTWQPRRSAACWRMMREFYTKRLKRTNSPAMLKALLINSAQSVDRRCTERGRQHGEPSGMGPAEDLQRAAPALADANRTLENIWPLRMIDQSLTNALATVQSRSWEITLEDDMMIYPLRFVGLDPTRPGTRTPVSSSSTTST